MKSSKVVGRGLPERGTNERATRDAEDVRRARLLREGRREVAPELLVQRHRHASDETNPKAGLQGRAGCLTFLFFPMFIVFLFFFGGGGGFFVCELFACVVLCVEIHTYIYIYIHTYTYILRGGGRRAMQPFFDSWAQSVFLFFAGGERNRLL